MDLKPSNDTWQIQVSIFHAMRKVLFAGLAGGAVRRAASSRTGRANTRQPGGTSRARDAQRCD